MGQAELDATGRDRTGRLGGKERKEWICRKRKDRMSTEAPLRQKLNTNTRRTGSAPTMPWSGETGRWMATASRGASQQLSHPHLKSAVSGDFLSVSAVLVPQAAQIHTARQSGKAARVRASPVRRAPLEAFAMCTAFDTFLVKS